MCTRLSSPSSRVLSMLTCLSPVLGPVKLYTESCLTRRARNFHIFIALHSCFCPFFGPACLLSYPLVSRCFEAEKIMSRSSPPVPDSVNGPKSSSSESYAQSDANIRNFAPVARIMKSALPENAKIAKEAKECMQECVSEFISFITSEGTWVF